jgi:DNA-binding XRE family transcriptional regulator
MQNKLKNYREELGLTQSELAEKSGVARTIVSYIETEKEVDVKLSTLTALSNAVGKKVSEVFSI